MTGEFADMDANGVYRLRGKNNMVNAQSVIPATNEQWFDHGRKHGHEEALQGFEKKFNLRVEQIPVGSRKLRTLQSHMHEYLPEHEGQYRPQMEALARHNGGKLMRRAVYYGPWEEQEVD